MKKKTNFKLNLFLWHLQAMHVRDLGVYNLIYCNVANLKYHVCNTSDRFMIIVLRFGQVKKTGIFSISWRLCLLHLIPA